MTLEEYRGKVLGCWMGKNIGGTLGAPFEWRRQVNNVSFYTQELGGEPLPNDDLDAQLIWLVMLEEQGIHISAETVAEYWQSFMAPFWAEYGNAKINMQAGLPPPFTGMRNNFYKDSCGAFIRSEIWACITPGCPQAAARYAYMDASLDHGDGEGTYAELFCAAMESAAFVLSDREKLINIGLSYIPDDCGVAKAVRCVQDCYHTKKTWRQARDKVLEHFRGDFFFGNMSLVSPEDTAKGFAEGKAGWDAPSNIGMLIIGLLYGENDFEKSLCIAVNCGEDTDCTGATLGAIFGIMHGIGSIPERWTKPIGRGIKTLCLNSGDLGSFGSLVPGTIDALTERTQRIMLKVAAEQSLAVDIPAVSATVPDENALYADSAQTAYTRASALRQSSTFFDAALEYPAGVTIRPGQAAPVRLTLASKYRIQTGLNIRWYTPVGWSVSPGQEGKAFLGQCHWPNSRLTLEFTLTPPEQATSENRFVLELTVDGRSTIMLIPVRLLVEYQF